MVRTFVKKLAAAAPEYGCWDTMVSDFVNMLATNRRTTPICRRRGIKVKVFVNVATLLAAISLKVKIFVNDASGQGVQSPLWGWCFNLQVRTYVNAHGADGPSRDL
jgi:hypothetical protein